MLSLETRHSTKKNGIVVRTLIWIWPVHNLSQWGVPQFWLGGGEGYYSPGLGVHQLWLEVVPQCWVGDTQSWLGGTSVLGSSPALGTPGKDLGPETWKRTWDWGTSRKDLGKDTWERTWDWGIPGKDLGPDIWERTWDWVSPPPLWVWTDKETEIITFSHPSNAGGNKTIYGWQNDDCQYYLQND